MPESIHGFKIGSSEYQYDYTYLSNKPEAIPTYDTDGSDNGKVLIIDNNQLTWDNALPNPEDASIGQVLRVSDSYEAVWDNISEVPDNSSGEGGYVLTADGSGDYTWENRGLPTWGHDDQGKVLTIHYYSGEAAPGWEDVLPYYDDSYAGYVLSVNQSGELEWIQLQQ